MTSNRRRERDHLDVIVVGRANIDLTLYVPQRANPRTTVSATAMATAPGGKALNQAVAVNRLGGRSALVTNIGDDEWGRLIRRCLDDANVETTGTHTVTGAVTGAAIVQVTPDADNAIMLAVSPDTELTAHDVTTTLTRINAPVVVTQLDLPPEAVAAAIAAPRSATLIANLIPRPGFDRDLLTRVDLLVVNEHEAAVILDDLLDPLAAARRLRELGPATAVVTAGPAGAAYHSRAQHGIIPAPAIAAVDTTGAGDTFLAALALALARRIPLPDAIGRAVTAGADATRHHGALLPAPDMNNT